MTSPTAPDADTDRGTVGDILLARGYITEEQLSHAVASQQQTGKPLGQVLVEAGAITRLELASALAEQWSDTATWLGPPATTPGRESKRKRAAPVEDDSSSLEGHEAGFTQQLQEAVVSLARRVAAFEPELADLKLRLETDESENAQRVLDRVEVVQDGLTVLSRRIDELTEGTEGALAAIHEGSADLAGEIAALTARMEVAAETTAIDELRSRVDDLDGRPVGNPELDGAVEQLAGRLDELTGKLDELGDAMAGRADAASVEALRGSVDELAAGIEQRADSASLAEARERIEELRAALGERAESTALEALRGEVAELASRPQSDPGLADRLEELTGRIEALAGTDALDSVRAAVEEIAGRPGADPEVAGRIDQLAARVDDLAAGIEQRADGASLAAAHERIEELSAGLAERAENAELEQLRAVIEALAARPQADPGLADRLEELTGRIEALAGTDALDSVRAAVEEIAGRPGADPEVAGRIDELAARVDELAAGLEARPEHEALALVQAALDELSSRIGSLAEAEALEELRTSIAEVSDRPAVAPELLEQLSELAARIEALAADSGSGDAAGVEAVRAELAELASRTSGDPELERRLDHVVSRLDALHARIEDVATIDTGAPDAQLSDSVASISSRVEELAAALDAVGASASSDELAEVRAQLDGVAARLGAVDEIGERLQRVEETALAAPSAEPVDNGALLAELDSKIAAAADRIAKETAAALEQWASERAALEARLDTLATALADAKTQTLTRAVAPAAPEPPARGKAKTKEAPAEEAPANVESELERLRMAVERINMHLGERERAIAELIRSKGDVKVEDLAARIAELEQASGAAPKSSGKGGATPAGDGDLHTELRNLSQRLEETEKLAKADRDKVLTQLERMASSIDWRFRRLETGEESAA